MFLLKYKEYLKQKMGWGVRDKKKVNNNVKMFNRSVPLVTRNTKLSNYAMLSSQKRS